MTDSLEGLRARLDGGCTSAEFRAALMDVPAVRRERHIDALFQLDELLRRQRHKVDTFLFTLLSHDSFLLVTKGYE